MTTPPTGSVRRLVLTDASGTILATTVHPADADADPGAPTFGGFIALDGQVVHTIDLPLHLTDHDGLRRLHLNHKIEVRDGNAELATL